jgi:hypothetical protein
MKNLCSVYGNDTIQESEGFVQHQIIAEIQV